MSDLFIFVSGCALASLIWIVAHFILVERKKAEKGEIIKPKFESRNIFPDFQHVDTTGELIGKNIDDQWDKVKKIDDLLV